MLTIFTPTYNRKHLLERLYESLKEQTNKSFEWLIVDDGSHDETEEYINELIDEKEVNIRYFRQENMGKHVAFNYAINQAKGEILLCVDSDDILSNKFVVDDLNKLWEKCKLNKKCCGIVSLKGLFNKTLLGSPLPSELDFCSPFDAKGGERNFTLRTEYLKDCLYPCFPGEKFCPDSYITDKLSISYDVHVRREIDVLCEYQNDGLSNNFKRLMKNNPKGFCISNMQIIDLQHSLIKTISTAIRYWAFAFMAKEFDIKYIGKNKLIVKFCFLPGFLYHLYYKLRL